jgi:hypothetical protein
MLPHSYAIIRNCTAKYLEILTFLNFFSKMLSVSYLMDSTLKAAQTNITSSVPELKGLRV